MKTALVSVSDKTGIVEFAQNLVKLGWRIVSTGGTYRLLAENNVENLVKVIDFTGSPEGLDGRIKTLTPAVFGGILNLRNNPEHQKFCTDNNIEHLDMVVVNLYPFKSTYYDQDASDADKVEKIDIGGPSMIRAAAKNYEFCASVVDPADYDQIITELDENGDLTLQTKKNLAAKTFEMTAHYDLLIAKFWNEYAGKMPLRYGENPHQKASVITDPFTDGMDLVNAKILNGKPMSYNNFNDANGAIELAASFDEPFAAVFKHACPCCAAVGTDIEDAFTRAMEDGDTQAAFGGILAFNRIVTKSVAEKCITFFNEIILAPGYEPEALEILKQKKNVRVIELNELRQTPDISVRKIRGGTLLQDTDIKTITVDDLSYATTQKPTETQLQDMLLAWKLVKVVKSNAIVVVKNGAMIGHGGGQVSRVRAMEIAIREAGDRVSGCVLASDAFFPFPDAVEMAGASGVAAIIQPGGSKNDQIVFDTCEKLGIPTVLTKTRVFLH
jgi:phosphoribosylaminoimidazolecarboxamide formyltransferase/IMP cyclohydrolase